MRGPKRRQRQPSLQLQASRTRSVSWLPASEHTPFVLHRFESHGWIPLSVRISDRSGGDESLVTTKVQSDNRFQLLNQGDLYRKQVPKFQKCRPIRNTIYHDDDRT